MSGKYNNYTEMLSGYLNISKLTYYLSKLFLREECVCGWGKIFVSTAKNVSDLCNF